MSAAEVADVDAIHPGYGFLSENSHFAEVCRSCNITFIGPPPEAIDLMGDKSKAKEVAKAAGIPTIPGSEGPVTSEKEALEVARQFGYPVMIKAVAGGGGRGMRMATRRLAGERLLRGAPRRGGVRRQRRLPREDDREARHIEVQFIADGHGQVFSLGERDCTTQRRRRS